MHTSHNSISSAKLVAFLSKSFIQANLGACKYAPDRTIAKAGKKCRHRAAWSISVRTVRPLSISLAEAGTAVIPEGALRPAERFDPDHRVYRRIGEAVVASGEEIDR